MCFCAVRVRTMQSAKVIITVYPHCLYIMWRLDSSLSLPGFQFSITVFPSKHFVQ